MLKNLANEWCAFLKEDTKWYSMPSAWKNVPVAFRKMGKSVTDRSSGSDIIRPCRTLLFLIKLHFVSYLKAQSLNGNRNVAIQITDPSAVMPGPS